jgi:hypothetical protein
MMSQTIKSEFLKSVRKSDLGSSYKANSNHKNNNENQTFNLINIDDNYNYDQSTNAMISKLRVSPCSKTINTYKQDADTFNQTYNMNKASPPSMIHANYETDNNKSQHNFLSKK